VAVIDPDLVVAEPLTSPGIRCPSWLEVAPCGSVAKGRQVVEQMRNILTSDGRTLAQAALGALWARSERCLPIPGFKTVAQVRENVGALQYGPLSPPQMQAIADLVTASLTEEEAQAL
jgi:aryl-alcohol dehydrogenase-like predicted oxidoreductase